MTIVSCLFLAIFTLTNRSFESELIKWFWLTITCTLILVAVDSLELWAATWDHPSHFRVLMSTIGYSLRPLGAFCLLCILTRATTIIKWLSIPLAANAICVFSAHISPLAFYYNDSNVFVRGPLGGFPFLVSAFYLIAIVIFTVRKYNEGNQHESLIAFFISAILAISSVAESGFGFDGFLNASSAMSVIFYYLYLHTQQFKRDQLANLLNRREWIYDLGLSANTGANQCRTPVDSGRYAQNTLHVRYLPLHLRARRWFWTGGRAGWFRDVSGQAAIKRVTEFYGVQWKFFQTPQLPESS